jgi:type I restriction enzyme R subunit
MKSLNFEFLRPYHEEFCLIGALAERSLWLDPSNAATKARMFAEKTVELIYEQFRVPLPFSNNLHDRLINEEFKDALNNQPILSKLFLMKNLGNPGAHTTQVEIANAKTALTEAHDVGRWMYSTFWNGNPEDVPPFQLPPDPKIAAGQRKEEAAKLRSELAASNAELQAMFEKLEAARARQTLAEKSLAELQALAAVGQRAAETLKFSESETRKRLIDSMLTAAGWNTEDAEEIGQEVVLRNGERCDYALFDDNGAPLAVIEAKKTAKDAESGRTQAAAYADQLETETGQRPVIFYTNGFETYIWNDAANEPPRHVFGFYSKDSLQYLIFQRRNRLPLTEITPDANIAGRIYQIEAIKRVAERFSEGRRKALLVQATGTGKTRVAVSLCELLYRARWAKRILFLCDRRELRKQADDVFKEFLPAEPRTIVSQATANDRDKRIYLATYPAMMQSYENYDVGFFDLIIADESHRSIYNRFRDLFLYFDCPQIGLTATPVNFIARNTFEIFDCNNGDPTANFDYHEAVNHQPPYLVPFEVTDATTDFMRRGIKYRQLNEEQRRQLEESEEDAQMVDYEPEQLNRLIFNRPTNEFILKHLMENGIREQSGQYVGKTIIFARNHDHAVYLQGIFDKLYPQYGGGFCRVIDSHDPRADELITEFKKPDSRLVVAISVDMLDTGIDVPEIVNLVFAKPVKSFVKFWQMIGRGTRLREHLFGFGQHKKKFYIFDHCGNFEYFGERYREAEPSQRKPLLQKLFEARIRLAEAAITAQDPATFDETIQLIEQDVHALPQNSISVKEKLPAVFEIQQPQVLKRFAPTTVQSLRQQIAPLMQWRDISGAEKMFEFDLLLTRLMIEKLNNSAAFADRRDDLREAVGRLPINLNTVREKIDLIQKIKNLQFWDTAGISEIETLRHELRGLMKLAAETPTVRASVRETNVDEDDAKIIRERIVPKLEGLHLINYKYRVQAVLESLIDESPALQKVKRGERLAAQDFDELCKLVLAQDPELDLRDLQKHFPDLADNLDIAVRSIIGLHSDAVNMRFEDFVQRNNLNSKQIRFLSLLKNHLTKYGTVEVARLYDAPFTDIDSAGLDGVFSNEAQIEELLAILDNLKSPGSNFIN